MADKDELYTLSIRDVARLLEKREASPVEVVESVLRRIEAFSDKLKAFITVTGEQALAAARAAETAIAAGYYLGPLHGVTVAFKDNVYTRGVRTTAGSKVLGNFVPDADATVAARLRAAGAIIVGKLNMHEFAWGGTSDNPHYGTVRNPWNPERFPAGSSGGAGVAVAARLCHGALGTDTGGSVRLPSAVNGIVGIRPTIGRVSNYNVVPLAWSMDTVGPMTRTVEDCAIMLRAIGGHDASDPTTANVPVPDYAAALGRGVSGLRLAIIEGYSLTHLQDDVRAAVQGALEVLNKEGATIQEVRVTDLEHNMSAQLTIESAEPSAYHQAWLREHPQDYGEDVRTLLELGEMYLATHYIQAQRYRAHLRHQLLEILSDASAIICPTLPFVATPVGETKVIIEGGQEEDMLSAIMQYTALPSLSGLPSLSVPCGFSKDGLPVGMQIIGRPFDEATLFRIGHAYQQVTDWHKREPNL